MLILQPHHFLFVLFHFDVCNYNFNDHSYWNINIMHLGCERISKITTEAAPENERKLLLREASVAVRSKPALTLGALFGIRFLENSVSLRVVKAHYMIRNAHGVKIAQRGRGRGNSVLQESHGCFRKGLFGSSSLVRSMRSVFPEGMIK